jgi:hypothetical protein
MHEDQTQTVEEEEQEIEESKTPTEPLDPKRITPYPTRPIRAVDPRIKRPT